MNPTRVFFTGKLKCGKDFCAAKANLDILGFADPLYHIQHTFFGTDDKNLPGARELLQQLGQWGRGEITEKYTLSALRAVMTVLIRNMGANNRFDARYLVKWEEFGVNKDLWVEALLRRAASRTSSIGVVNVRFNNEFAALRKAGWDHYHVMCSAGTWKQRLQAVGLHVNSPEVKDLSEQLALHLDNEVSKIISQQPQGNKLKVIWSDDQVPPPSPRMLTVDEFLRRIAA